MKRFFILATAAIVALASCAKTEVVYNDAPKEIAFKALNGAMTKADALGDKGYTDMGVYAFDEEGEPYFSQVKFAPATAGADWTATPQAQYWPLSGSLNFVYYAPWFAVNATASTLTAQLTTATDFMYGTEVVNASKQNTAIGAPLRHALAKINVSVTSDLEGLVINSLTLTSAYTNAELTVNYSTTDNDQTSNDERLSFDFNGATVTNITFANVAGTTEANVKYSDACYVMPHEQTSLVLNYTLPGADAALEYEHELEDNWYDGHQYTYDFLIGANEIKFTPSETTWATGADEDITVDPNM